MRYQNCRHLHPMANCHHLHPLALPGNRRGDGSQFSYQNICTRNHNYLLHQLPRYYRRELIPYEAYGNNVRGGLPEMRYTGRLQNPHFEISFSHGSHLHPSYLHNHQVHLHRTQPPMQATESINFNPRSQIPSSSSHMHQIYNIDDGHRNFWPPIPIEQWTNQRIPPPEVSSFGHRPAMRILDDVMLMDGVPNSDISNRWFNNEDVPYEELLNIADGNRNFRPSTHIEQRTNQDNLTPEFSGIDLPTIHLQDGVILVDDVIEAEALVVDLQEPDLRELLGLVKTGLSQETIRRHLRTRTHISSANNLDLNKGLTSDQVPEICVVCQDEYENHEEIGTLQCGHEYHAECITKWLQQKNVCPICKAKALPV